MIGDNIHPSDIVFIDGDAILKHFIAMTFASWAKPSRICMI